MIRRLLPYCRGAYFDIVGGAVLLLLTAALELLQPWPIKWLVDYVFGKAIPPHWLHRICPWLSGQGIGAAIVGVCLSVLVLAILYRMTQVAGQFLLIRAGGRLVLSLRSAVADHLHNLSAGYHDRTTVGDSLYRAAYDTCCVQSLFSSAVAPVVTGVLTLVGIVAVMFVLDPILALIALAMLPAFWGLIRLFGGLIEDRSRRQQRHERALVERITESLSVIRIIQAFAQERYASGRFTSEGAGSFQASKRLTFVQLLFAGAIGLAMAGGTATVIGVGAWRVAQGRLLVGDILVFLSYLGMLYSPVNAFAQSAGVIQAAKTQLQRVFETLDLASPVAERTNAIALANVRGDIEFCNVDFSYQPGGELVLRDLGFRVRAGQTVALVGRTGAGKSTLAGLLLRFYDPTSGRILIDGYDLRDLRLTALRRHVSLVPQEPILLAGTIHDNVALGRDGATRQQVIDATRHAQAHEFIQQLPDGYDAYVEERGANFSLGQRQRLAIARALLKDAPIIILDEPTSALDAHTEAALVQAMQELLKDRTAFVIAHRLSTVRQADLILVLDEGRIIEQGTHDELLSIDSAYRRLCQKQWGVHPGSEVSPLAPIGAQGGR